MWTPLAENVDPKSWDGFAPRTPVRSWPSADSSSRWDIDIACMERVYLAAPTLFSGEREKLFSFMDVSGTDTGGARSRVYRNPEKISGFQSSNPIGHAMKKTNAPSRERGGRC